MARDDAERIRAGAVGTQDNTFFVLIFLLLQGCAFNHNFQQLFRKSVSIIPFLISRTSLAVLRGWKAGSVLRNHLSNCDSMSPSC